MTTSVEQPEVHEGADDWARGVTHALADTGFLFAHFRPDSETLGWRLQFQNPDPVGLHIVMLSIDDWLTVQSQPEGDIVLSLDDVVDLQDQVALARILRNQFGFFARLDVHKSTISPEMIRIAVGAIMTMVEEMRIASARAKSPT